MANLIQPLYSGDRAGTISLTMTDSFFGYLILHLSASSCFRDISCIQLCDLFLALMYRYDYVSPSFHAFLRLSCPVLQFYSCLSCPASRTLVCAQLMICANTHVGWPTRLRLVFAVLNVCMPYAIEICLVIHNIKIMDSMEFRYRHILHLRRVDYGGPCWSRSRLLPIMRHSRCCG